MTLLIWRSLLHRKIQNLAIIVAIAIGAGIVFCAAAIFQGVVSGLELSKQRMGADIVIVPFGVTMDPSLILFGGAAANSYMPADTANAVRAIPGVRRATPQFFTHTLTADCHDIGTNNRMLGYDPDSDWVVKPWLKKLNKAGLAADEVILGAKVPTWTENRIAILGKWYSIVAVAEETGTTLDYSLFVNMEEARRVVGANPYLNKVWEKQGPPAGLISAILVQVDPTANVMDIVTRIQELGLLQPIVAADVKKKIGDQFTVLVLLLGGVGLLTGAASLFQLFSRFYALTVERQAEWGLYLAIGASARDIAIVIVGEAAAVAAAGSLGGLILGTALYKISLTLLEAYQAFPFIPPSWTFLVTAGLLIAGIFSGCGALAAWFPALRGSRVDPATVMTRGEFD